MLNPQMIAEVRQHAPLDSKKTYRGVLVDLAVTS